MNLSKDNQDKYLWNLENKDDQVNDTTKGSKKEWN